MVKLRKKFFICLCLISLGIIIALSCTVLSKNVWAYEQQEDNNNQVSSDAETRGIYTYLSLTLNSVDGKIVATVRNDVTIFPATVYVVVQLYSSVTYCENYQDMTLESMNVIADLNMGQTISTEASPNGQQKYWIGRMRYRIDNKSWQEKTLGPSLFDANGGFII